MHSSKINRWRQQRDSFDFGGQLSAEPIDNIGTFAEKPRSIVAPVAIAIASFLFFVGFIVWATFYR